MIKVLELRHASPLGLFSSAMIPSPSTRNSAEIIIASGIPFNMTLTQIIAVIGLK
jgi:hypothetical protein